MNNVNAKLPVEFQIIGQANQDQNLKNQEKIHNMDEKSQKITAIGMGLGLAWAAYGLCTGNHTHTLQGLSVTGVLPLGYHFNKISTQQAWNIELQDNASTFHKVVQICQNDSLYGTGTVASLGLITYGLANGFVTGDFSQAKVGIGGLGMLNLILGNISRLSDNDKAAKTCIQVGSLASVAFFLLSQKQGNIMIPFGNSLYRCVPETKSILDMFKQALNVF